MLLYHANSNSPVDCHPSQVESMIANGWLEQKPKPAAKQKPETKQTKEKENG